MKLNMKPIIVAGMCLLCGLAVSPYVGAQDSAPETTTRQAVVWTSADPDVAHRMVLMYMHASQNAGWFDENLVIVWGPSARLLAGDKDLQAKVKAMMKDGVRFQACVVCADMYGVTPMLRDMGLEVKAMGKPLSRLLQDDGWKVMTF
jgi:hypothetical protein